MVAYSFHPIFAPAVVDGSKGQTIRAERRHPARHARPGERVQLYTGLRTRQARKLVTPDPVCRAVRSITIIRAAVGASIQGIRVDGVPVEDLEAFARADGFRHGSAWDHPVRLPAAVLGPGVDIHREVRGQGVVAMTALGNMALFWAARHGVGGAPWSGALIRWGHDDAAEGGER